MSDLQTTSNNENPAVFLNQPIKKKREDVLGSYYDAEIISAAIDKGAEMIAITSSFGAGKSSVTDMLEEVRKGKNEDIIKVSMWSQLYKTAEISKASYDRKQEQSVKEMHKNFLYQIVTQMDRKRGTFVIKRLSSNYDVLSIRTKSKGIGVVIILACLIAAALYIDRMVVPLELVTTGRIIARTVMYVVCFVLAIITFLNSELLFSFHNTKHAQDISIDELIDIYKEEVLGSSFGCKKAKKLIVIVEDLDRTKNGKAVTDFLIQLRRYYIDSKTTGIQKNKNRRNVSFIVNLNKESIVCNIEDGKEEDSLYEKIFDYIYDLNEINNIDYEHVLKRLLEEENLQTMLSEIGFQGGEDALGIPGMRWILWGEVLNIRLLKDRLNRSFGKYYVLTHRGENTADVSFEKCAAAAYLTTRYEQDICNMEDGFIEELLSVKIEKGLGKEQVETIKKESNLDERFIDDLAEMINNGIIESDYRQYLFNYPERAKMLTREELIVQKALLYKTKYKEEDVAESINAVTKNNPAIIKDALSKLEKHGKIIPTIVLKNEVLFGITVKESPVSIYDWFEARDYINGLDEIIDVVSTIFSFQDVNQRLSSEMLEKISDIWAQKITPEDVTQLRKVICDVSAERIDCFYNLFFETFPIITKEELDLLPLETGVIMINQKSSNFNSSYLRYINKRHTEITNSNQEIIERFFIDSVDNIKNNNNDISHLYEYVSFMKLMDKSIPELAKQVINVGDCIASWNAGGQVSNEAAEQFQSLIGEYIDLVNQLGHKRLDENTKDALLSVLLTGRYNILNEIDDQIAKQMNDGKHSIGSVIIRVCNNSGINFKDRKTIAAINDNKKFLLTNRAILKAIRQKLLIEGTGEIKEYQELFDKECGTVSREELEALISHKTKKKDIEILCVIKPELINEENVLYITEYFNREDQGRAFAYEYCNKIAKMDSIIGRKMFELTDFERIHYYSIAKSSRKEIMDIYEKKFPVSNTTEAIWFMERVRFAEPLLTSRVEKDVKNNKEIRDRYINMINTSNWGTTKREALTPVTKGQYCAFREDVSNLLNRIGRIDWYIASKTLNAGCFEYEPIEEYWPSQVRLFTGNNKEVAEMMSRNTMFVEDAIAKGVYKLVPGGTTEKRILFVNSNQSKDSLQEVYDNYDVGFKTEYYSKIKGFKDREAAVWFVDMIVNDRELIISNEIYNNTHDKLEDWKLKRKYTYNRNQIINVEKQDG